MGSAGNCHWVSSLGRVLERDEPEPGDLPSFDNTVNLRSIGRCLWGGYRLLQALPSADEGVFFVLGLVVTLRL